MAARRLWGGAGGESGPCNWSLRLSQWEGRWAEAKFRKAWEVGSCARRRGGGPSVRAREAHVHAGVSQTWPRLLRGLWAGDRRAGGRQTGVGDKAPGPGRRGELRDGKEGAIFRETTTHGVLCAQFSEPKLCFLKRLPFRALELSVCSAHLI